jgi:vacuolar-type H+-ATPase subunit H
VDEELKAYLDRNFRELREETSRQFREAREETSREFREVREELGGVREELGEVREETSRQFGEVREDNRLSRVLLEGLRSEVQLVAEGVMGISERLEAHQSATLLKFDEVKASIVPYYQDLNRRVGILEGRADRQTRDVIDVIREKFGKG